MSCSESDILILRFLKTGYGLLKTVSELNKVLKLSYLFTPLVPIHVFALVVPLISTIFPDGIAKMSGKKAQSIDLPGEKMGEHKKNR